jgi:predicted PurR-regulated permease PerM
MSSRQDPTRKVRRRVQVGLPASPANHQIRSPQWNNTVKLVTTLGLLFVVGWLVFRFREVVGVLMVSVFLAYLLYPAADNLRRWTHISWRLSATLVFLFSLILVIGLITLGGLAIVDQAQSLIGFLQNAFKDLPGLVEKLPSFTFGTFHFPPTNIDELATYGQNLLGMVQPVLTQTTSIVTAVASGAASTIGWIFFAFLVAYFILAESGGIRGRMIHFHIPGYHDDLVKMGRYLSGIWNAFLRGQLTIIFITIVVYIVILSILGVHYSVGLALLAGLARFIPYVGPFVAWTTYGLVAFFQGNTPFGLPPLGYVVLVVGTAWVTDLIMDNFVSARLMGNALKIHPAAVMVSAIIGVNLLGLTGVLLAAPVVATMKLLLDYVFNKLLDREPWEGIETTSPPINRPIRDVIRFWYARIRGWVMRAFRRGATLPDA